MDDRPSFCRNLARQESSHSDRAIALLWYYQKTQQFEERTASGLANDLQDEGFPRPHVTRLKSRLARSRFVASGRRSGTFRLNVRYLDQLDEKYDELLAAKRVPVSDSIIPLEWVAGSPGHVQRLVQQINGCYDLGFYDACAALCRRLMESLIIQVYLVNGRREHIQANGVFVGLEALIQRVCNDDEIAVGRNSNRTMVQIKGIGDTAAHDRSYITPQIDIDDVKAAYRRVINELLTLCQMRN